MPIYEYVCRDCGHELEQLQRLSDDALTQCPSCGQSTLKRKISAAGFRLSGGGWYETDFKSDGRRNLAGADAKESTSDAGKSAESKSGDAKSGEKQTGQSKGDQSKTGDSASKDVKPAKEGSGANVKKDASRKDSKPSSP